MSDKPNKHSPYVEMQLIVIDVIDVAIKTEVRMKKFRKKFIAAITI